MAATRTRDRNPTEAPENQRILMALSFSDSPHITSEGVTPKENANSCGKQRAGAEQNYFRRIALLCASLATAASVSASRSAQIFVQPALCAVSMLTVPSAL